MLQKDDVKRREEHEAVRNNVGYYDFTHQLLEISGKDSTDFINELFVAPFNNSQVNTAKYTTMLNEDGEIIDDIIVFKFDDNDYKVSTLFINELIDWIEKHKNGYEIEYKDITPENTMFAVQGPNSRKVLNDLLNEPIDDLKHFHIMPNGVDDMDVTVIRSGYTGELGYELYVLPEEAEKLEKLLIEAGNKYDLKNITTDVIVTSLPREKGYVLMSDLEGLNPLEAGYGWTIGWDTDFIGKDKLKKGEEPEKKLLGFVVEDDTAVLEPGDIVSANGEDVGKVTVYTYGYTVGNNIGFAVVETDKVKIGDKVLIGEKEVPATITERIFYDEDNSRVMA